MSLLSTIAGDREIEALMGDDAQLQAMLKVERALADASAEAGLISSEAAVAIGGGIEGFEPDWPALERGMARDGVVIPELVAQLRKAVPAAHRDALHKGATSQDVVDTALMIQASKVLDVLQSRLADLIAQLSALEKGEGARPLMGRTRMQAALPTTWAHKLASWSRPLQRHLDAIEAMRVDLLAVQLGGPVGDRSSFDGKGDEVATGLARRLDLAPAPPWHASRDRTIMLGSRLAAVTGSMGKVGADISMLAQTEVAALRVEGAGASSAMPHKSNPVAAEALVALAWFNAGLVGTLQQAMIHENERSGAAWTLEWLTLPRIFVITGASLRIGLGLLEHIRLT
jgi:3-carboxy-cis,cis-muconate cycloisomerase